MSDGEGGPRRWLFAACAACTAWLVVQNLALLVFAVFFDGPITLSAGWESGGVVMAVLAIIAAGTFTTAFQRTLWIGTRLRERDRAQAPPR